MIQAPVQCSPRRWERHGVRYVSLINWALVFCYTVLHWPPERLYRWYYGKELASGKRA